MTPKPLIYKVRQQWAIAPRGNKNELGCIIASNTLSGAFKIAKQCYNPLRK